MTKRTQQQNKAMRLYWRLVADEMREGGIDSRVVISVPVDATAAQAEHNIWRPIMAALYPDIKSTADLTNEQMTDIYEHMNIALGELGISVPWPCEDELRMRSYES